MIKFIATDMDGTLLNSQKQMPSDFEAVFNGLKSKGILFAAASGRQYASLKNTFSPYADDMLFIAENGTLVMHQGQELYSSEIPLSDVQRIVKTVRRIQGAHIVVCGKHRAYVETQDSAALIEIKKYYHELSYTPDLLSVTDEFIKVAVLHDDDSQTCVYPIVAPIFSDSHQVVVSAKHWLDFMHKQASKGAAIRHLQETLNFTFEESMSFGDYLNDIEMLKETYHSYAMDNAHPEIKALARFQAPSNDAEGVTQTIKNVLLKSS
ncbi:Cof-type HAD-IIB family hydrolase [Vibrio sp.]|nr:Cof-type HAD-IIB family hydrolase [Vibrio sp.]